MLGLWRVSEGIDQKLALHYYSRVAFTEQLMPLLERGEDARVLTVLSAGVHKAYEGYATDPGQGAQRGASSRRDTAEDALVVVLCVCEQTCRPRSRCPTPPTPQASTMTSL